MRTRFAHSRLLRLVIVAALVGVLAPLAVFAGPVPNASACSFKSESVEVSPSPEVMPGDWLTVRGSGFLNISYEPVEPEIDPDTGLPVPQDSCGGIVIEPKDPVVIFIAGQVVGSTAGPDFEVEVQVPGDVGPGPTTLSAGSTSVELLVGSTGPEPCPVYLAQGAPVAQQVLPPGCPDPCGGVGGAAVWCPPDPCPLYVDNGALQVLPPGCPDPCDLVRPAIGDGVCPPEPCPVYLAQGAPVTQQVLPPKCPDPCAFGDGPAVWCPPEPCPVYLAQGAPVTQQVLPPECPDPCGGVGGDAVWCPPGPCPLYVDNGALQVLPPECPDPCGFDGGPAVDYPCPPAPCEPADVVDDWCPEPCHLVGGDAVVCGDPEPVPAPWDDAEPLPAAEPDREPRPEPAPDRTATTRQDPPKPPASIVAVSTSDDRVEPAPATIAVERLHERSVEAIRELLVIASLGIFGGSTS